MATIYNKITGNTIELYNEDVINTLRNDKDYIVKDSKIEIDAEIAGEVQEEPQPAKSKEFSYNTKTNVEDLKKIADELGIDTEGLTKKELLAVLDRETKNA